VTDFTLAGCIQAPDGDGAAGGSACGDRVRITLRVVGEQIVGARFGALACPAATAAAAWCATRAQGRPFLAAARLSVSDCLRDLELEAARADCALIALDALHAALGDALSRVALASAPERVVVAMSGGVDSAVALARTHASGADAVGLTMRLWIDPAAPDASRACCSPDAVRRARDLCHSLGLPHITLDGREAFRAAVVDPFVSAYAAGETPNPCTRCNGSYRLDAMVGAADALGAPVLATGHYARRVRRGDVALVARAADPAKDQSYMLARVRPAVIERLRFPLAADTKDAVRAEASSQGFAAAGVRESQDVCFLGGGDLRGFLVRHGFDDEAGDIVDETGAVLGHHAGAAAFTPGQRRGLGVAAAAPLYVLRTEPARGVVVVGGSERLQRGQVDLRETVLHLPLRRVEAKLRARSPAVGATIEPLTGPGRLRLLLDEPVSAIAPGQTAALYDADGAVVGSGIIDAG